LSVRRLSVVAAHVNRRLGRGGATALATAREGLRSILKLLRLSQNPLWWARFGESGQPVGVLGGVIPSGGDDKSTS
jgi:hypothetical protein